MFYIYNPPEAEAQRYSAQSELNYKTERENHVDLTVLSIFQKAATFDHNLTPYT